MKFYKSEMWYSNGNHTVDYWVNKDDAMSYIENSPKYEGLLRSVLFEMTPDEKNFMYEKKCLFEYDSENGLLLHI